MRLSALFLPTVKEVPSDAQIASTKLMIRAAIMRKLSSGLYSYLPFGLKALHRVMNIIREEMNNAGAQEFMFPILLPKELLTPTGRWDTFKKELFRLKDRHDVEHALGATHEEAFTEMVKNEVQSYRQLPLNLYQMHTKFRDEIRPRFGVIRSREFIMKDAYSFHADDASLDETYRTMSRTYARIFSRMALETVNVKADSGAMGGEGSEEFMVLSEVGEEEIIFAPECDYRANVEKAECALEEPVDATQKAMELVDTPNVATIEDLEVFFNMSANNFIKTLIYQTEENEVVAVLIRGDVDVNDVKLSNVLGGKDIFLADERTIERVTGAAVGFAGPVGLKDVRIIADHSIKSVVNGVTGANETDKHYKNVNRDRDFTVTEWVDVRKVKAGDICHVDGKTPLQAKRGLELGHVFKLGKKYTEAFNLTVLDEKNNPLTPTMGCYGIGVNRTLAAIIEQHHDEKGIIFPISVAPYEVILITLDTKEPVLSEAEALYTALKEQGIDVLFDDRKERPGVKFNDADLIGIPLRIVIGKRGLANGTVEFRLRRESENRDVPKNEIIDYTVAEVKRLYDELRGDDA